MERLRTAVRNQNAPRDPWAKSPVRRSSMSEGSRKMVTGPGSHFGGKQVKGNRWTSGKRSRRSERREPVIEEDDTIYSSSRAGSGYAPTTQRVTRYETVYRPSSWAFSNGENRRDSGHGGDTTGSRSGDYLQGGPGRWRPSVPEAPRYSPRLQHETRKVPPQPQPPQSQQNIGVQSKLGDAVAAAAAAYCTGNRIPMRRVKGPTLVSGMHDERQPRSAAAAGKAPAPRPRGKSHHELLGYTPTGERRWRRYIFEDIPLEEQIDEEQEWVLGGYDLPPQRGEQVPETAVMVDREMLEREEAERQAAEQEAAERAAADRELAEYRAAEREAIARKAAEARAAKRHAAEREAAEKEAARRKEAEREVAQREAAQREKEERIAAEWEAERREEMEQLLQRDRIITEAREREKQREREIEMEREERERELEMERVEKEREIEMERQERARIENAMRQERERLDAAASAPRVKEEGEEEEGPESFVKEERYFFTEETVEEPMEEAEEMPVREVEPTGGIPAVGAWPEQGYQGRGDAEEEALEEEAAARENMERQREMRERDEAAMYEQEQQEEQEEQRMRNAREQAARQEEEQEEQAQAAERMRQERENEAAKQKPLSRGERRRSAKEDKAREKQRVKEEKARERESKKEARRSSKQAKKDEKERKEDEKKRARIEELRRRQLNQQNQHEQQRQSTSQQQPQQEEQLNEQHPSAKKKGQERQGSGLFNFLSRRSSKAEKKVPEMAAPSLPAGGV